MYDGDYNKIELKALKKYDNSIFEEHELDIIEKAKTFISTKTATELSEMSHEGEIWNSTPDNKFISFDKVTDLKMKL